MDDQDGTQSVEKFCPIMRDMNALEAILERLPHLLDRIYAHLDRLAMVDEDPGGQ